MWRTFLLIHFILSFAFTSPARAEDRQPKTFEVKVVGQGPPVILIPGLACSGEVWNTTVEHLKDRFECHVISIKGFGGVGAMEPLPSPLLPAVRNEIVAYIGDHALGHPVIIGHSLGGVVALDIAAAAPDLPRSLVIVDSSPFLPGTINPELQPESAEAVAGSVRKKMSGMTRGEFEASQALLIRTMASTQENVEYLTRMVNTSDQQTVTEALAELFLTDLRPELAKIKCPALVLLALAAPAIFKPAKEVEADLQKQFSGLSGAKFHFFDESRHFIMYDEPGNFFNVLDGALSGS